jgi:hypothetical protein
MTVPFQKTPRSLKVSGTPVPILNGVPLVLMTECELSDAMKFEGSTKAFRAWCRKIGIKSVPWRKGVYDPQLVRQRLDAVQELSQPIAANTEQPPLSLVEQRRARRGQG